MKSFVIALLAIGTLASFPALAAPEAKKLGEYGEWTAYTFQEDGKKVCFMAASPTDAKGAYKKRGSVYAMITHRPGDKTWDVFSYMSGYVYDAGKKVTLTIDGTDLTLVGTGETAWTPDDASDKKLVAALRKGSRMVVEGTSERGTATKDTFSLKGSGSAYDRMTEECKKSS